MSHHQRPVPTSAWRVIAIDTSRPLGCVAAGLLDVDRVPRQHEPTAAAFTQETLATPADHARLLAAAVERTASASGWSPAGANLVAVVVGPGSFTGLRVGVTAAKMLAWAVGCPLVGVSSFELLAFRGNAEAVNLWPDVSRLELALDAGRGEVHAASAVRDPAAAAGWRPGPPRLLPREAWLGDLDGGAVVVSSPGTLSTGRNDLRRLAADETTPSGRDVALIGLAHALQGAFADPAELVPTYLRPSYAEERRQT